MLNVHFVYRILRMYHPGGDRAFHRVLAEDAVFYAMRPITFFNRFWGALSD